MKCKIIYGLMSFCLMIACVSDFNPQIPLSGASLLVVEGHIIGNSTVDFHFSKSFSLEEIAPPDGYDDVAVNLVIIGDNGYRSSPAQYMGNGVHRLDISALDTNVSYGIEFVYEGNTFQSALSKPLVTPEIDEITWIQHEEFGDVALRVSTHDEDSSEPCYYLWSYTEDWEVLSTYAVCIFFNPEGAFYYLDETYPYHYCWKKNIGKDILIGTTEKLGENRILNKSLISYASSNDRFSYLYSIRIQQQAISRSAYEYYLDLIKSNSGMGGLFTPQPSQIEGNITCTTDKDRKVIGFVDVVNNLTDKRIFIGKEGVSRKVANPNCDVQDFSKGGMPEPSELYQEGYRPITYERLEFGGVTSKVWAKHRCTDCRALGGNKNKPDFWPNNHQ